MHPKVLSTDGWANVRRLSAAGLFQNWTLAGGKGLALQLGIVTQKTSISFGTEDPIPVT